MHEKHKASTRQNATTILRRMEKGQKQSTYVHAGLASIS
jgi:hypothetical protein